jgi:hypothetical protein
MMESERLQEFERQVQKHKDSRTADKERVGREKHAKRIKFLKEEMRVAELKVRFPWGMLRGREEGRKGPHKAFVAWMEAEGSKDREVQEVQNGQRLYQMPLGVVMEDRSITVFRRATQIRACEWGYTKDLVHENNRHKKGGGNAVGSVIQID